MLRRLLKRTALYLFAAGCGLALATWWAFDFAFDLSSIEGGWLALMFAATTLGLLGVAGRQLLDSRLSKKPFTAVQSPGQGSRSRSPFSGLPSWGLVCVVFLAPILLVAILAQTNFRRSRGLPVLALKPGALVETENGERKPTVVRIDAEGRAYLNSQRVSWEELARAAKESLGRNPDWAIYVEGAPDAAAGDIFHAVDILQTVHVRVVLLTPSSKLHNFR